MVYFKHGKETDCTFLSIAGSKGHYEKAMREDVLKHLYFDYFKPDISDDAYKHDFKPIIEELKNHAD